LNVDRAQYAINTLKYDDTEICPNTTYEPNFPCSYKNYGSVVVVGSKSTSTRSMCQKLMSNSEGRNLSYSGERDSLYYQ